MTKLTAAKCLLMISLSVVLASCAIAPETQAKMDEYQRTVPICDDASDCQSKWSQALAWVRANSDFGIRSASDIRIVSTTNLISDSGIGMVVERIPASNNTSRITIKMDCLSAYGCPQLWDKMLDFNRTVNGI